MPDITNLIRPDIAELEPYIPIVPPEIRAKQLGIPVQNIIKLDANENPFGPVPAVLEALASSSRYAIYPDPEQRGLRETLAWYTRLPIERIMCGAGADELIDMLVRLLLRPGDRVIDCPPTFGMYSFDTALSAGQVVDVPRRDDFSLDIPAIEQAIAETEAKIIFIASPNNPTGNPTPIDDIKRLVQLPVLVIVDEAYIEFTRNPRGVSTLVGAHENLVVLRTFSKWAGLAGMRVGYALLHENLAHHMWKIKQPYNVSVAAEIAALTSLKYLDELFDNISRIVFERERMLIALNKLPYLQVYPSQANFLLCRVVNGDALHIKQSLEQQGILVRYYNKDRLRDCLRLSIGTPDQMVAVQRALENVK